MSNTKKRSNGVFSLADYQAKVGKKDNDPFEFKVSDEETIVIPWPDADQIFEAEAAMRNADSKGLISALCEDDDQADRIFDLFGPLDARILAEFGSDLAKKFKLGG